MTEYDSNKPIQPLKDESPCVVTEDCPEAYFCDLDDKVCRKCKASCKICKNYRVCGYCYEPKQPNLIGTCENTCQRTTMPQNGEFCYNGDVFKCVPSLTMGCVCGGAVNCQSCNDDFTACDECLTGYKKVNDECVICEDGYEKYVSHCLPAQAERGRCTSLYNTCIAGTFCPTDDVNEVSCKSCKETISEGMGCNCVDDVLTMNCQTCEGGVCTACITGYGISGTSCEECGPGRFVDPETKTCANCTTSNCDKCSDPDTCTACLTDYTLIEGACVDGCSETKMCAGSDIFCNFSTGGCQKCPEKCTKCKNLEVCGGCTDPMKQLTISGGCEDYCPVKPQNGEYCQAGVITACRTGITSECTCGTAKNCATCSELPDQCEACLTGFTYVNGQCTQCEPGYELYESLCLEVQTNKNKKKMSWWLILIIFISIAVVLIIVICVTVHCVKKQRMLKASQSQLLEVKENSLQVLPKILQED